MDRWKYVPAFVMVPYLPCEIGVVVGNGKQNKTKQANNNNNNERFTALEIEY